MATNKLFARLNRRLAVVTGASSGIGLAFSRKIAESGGRLLMISNQANELEEAAATLRADYAVDVSTLCIDLADRQAPDAVVEAINRIGTTPLLLINDAGIFDFATSNSLSDRRIDLYIDLHMRTIVHLCRRISAMMANAGEGYILNMSSMSCWMAMPGIAMYSATKAFIHTYSRALRVELLDSGVSVTVACPGGISTALFGLPVNLRRLAVRLGVLVTPQHFARNALSRTLRRRPQYINGWLNRVAIVAVASLPEWFRRWGKRKFLDK
jgi:hypothetical protein